MESVLLPLHGYGFRAAVRQGGPVIVGLRPEHVQVARDGTVGPVIDARMLFMEPMGADTLVWFQFGGQRISARLPPYQARDLNGGVRLAFELDHVSLFDPTTEARL